MNESIINGIFALSGTLIGSLISYFIARKVKETKTLKAQVSILSKQVMSYWNLERIYSEELVKLVSKPAKTILQEYREKIVAMNLVRPTMTEKEAKNILIKNL
ncbi:MAG: hypothetical protein JSU07_14015 [Bacteroidetes bacterium]|nr:hypothetical protein [Bacteroidota bacterium]